MGGGECPESRNVNENYTMRSVSCANQVDMQIHAGEIGMLVCFSFCFHTMMLGCAMEQLCGFISI